MADFSLPTISSLYTAVITQLKGRDDDIAKMFDGTGSTNIPTDAIGWSSTNSRFEKWNGASWGALDSAYEINVTTFNGQAASYYTNASNLASGTLPAARFNDTSHGNRGGGTLHANASSSSGGFLSATDYDVIRRVKGTVSLYHSVAQTVNNGSFGDLSWDGELKDALGQHDTVTNPELISPAYTALVQFKARLYLSGTLPSVGTVLKFYIRTAANGTLMVLEPVYQGGNIIQLSTELKAVSSANQYKLSFNNDTGAAVTFNGGNGGGWSNFSMEYKE